MRLHFAPLALLASTLIAGSAAAATRQPDPRPARPDGEWSRWLSDADVPLMARARQIKGTTAFMLWINEAGRVSECIIKKSSGDHELDKATCDALIARGRFIPATDQDGKPVPCPWSSRVNWRL